MAEFTIVYDSVIGPKLRKCGNILGCADGEVLGILNMLWSWARYNTDDTGKILYADKTDIANYIRLQNRGSELDSQEVVDVLIECGWIDEVCGDLFIHDWDVWQAPWIKLKKTRERDAQRKRDARKREKEVAAQRELAGAKRDAAADNPQDSPPDTGADDPPDNPADALSGEQLEMEQLPELPEKPAGPKPLAYSDEFEAWWKVYPRRIAKGDAYKKYNARRKEGFSPEMLLEAAQNYAALCRKKRTEQSFILHPETFLNSSRKFEDYIKKEAQTEEESEDYEPSYKNPFAEYKGDHNE